MNELHLFAGAGGGILGGMLLGHTCVCAVEIEPYPRKVLFQRQRDGILPKFPIWDDITTFDAKPWRGHVDVVCGGFPCQDISAAGKGEGIDGKKSGLWSEMYRVVREVEPRYVFVENSPMLTSRGLGRVLGDLASVGYDARWCVLGGQHVGANVMRERLWILASPNVRGMGKRGFTAEPMGQSQSRRINERASGTDDGATLQGDSNRTIERISLAGWGEVKPRFLRMANGVANWMGRHRAIGNGQIPVVAATAWKLLDNSDLND